MGAWFFLEGVGTSFLPKKEVPNVPLEAGMRIVGVSWQGYGLPFRTPYVTSEGRATLKYGLLIFLRNNEGLVGVGEASPVGPGSAAQVQQAASMLDELSPQIVYGQVGRYMLSPPDETLPNLMALGLLPALAFGLETARLDLLGVSQGKSVAEMLGGAPRRLNVNAIIASDSPAQAAAEAAQAVALGFTSLKLKVGRGIEQDVALAAAVREAVGPGVKLRIDANQGWSVPQAIEAINRLARFGLEYVEQPVAAGDLAGMAEVRRSVSVNIAADEALRSAQDVGRILEAEAADIFILKAARLGGLRESLNAAEAAAKSGKAVVVTSSLESGVGLAASAHLASALASHPFAHGLGTGLLYAEDLLEKPLLPERGALLTPQGPGLGVSVDDRQLRRYAIGVTGSMGVPLGA